MHPDIESLLKQIQSNQRNEWRLEMVEPIRGEISLLDPYTGEPLTLSTEILDLSAGGLGIHTNVAIVRKNQLLPNGQDLTTLPIPIDISFQWNGQSIALKGLLIWNMDMTSEDQRYQYGVSLTFDTPDKQIEQERLMQHMVDTIRSRQFEFETWLNRKTI